MGGRDERRGGDPEEWDPDDWFADPEPAGAEPPGARRARAEEPRAEAEIAPVEPDAAEDDWLRPGDRRPARVPRRGPLAEPRLVLAGVGALVVLVVIVLALSGVFSSSSPRRAATTPPATTPATTGPGTTRAATTRSGTTTKATTTRPAPAAAPAPSGPLKPGDQGPQVTVLQRALASLGYSPGAIDGNYGLSTQRALSEFQSASKLTPDGILGPQTLLALRTALNGR
jgi:hypothetical protein